MSGLAMNRRFACFILTHGRPSRVYTVNALKKVGYTGDFYIVCDDEDETIDQYREAYGDRVCVFCKQEWFDRSDTCDCGESPRAVILPARNYCFRLAKELKLDAFLELDDDYTFFSVKGLRNGVLHDHLHFSTFDAICDAYIGFLEANENILAVCFAQNGDYIGGKLGGMFRDKVKFKGMNTFFCLTSRPFQFIGRINEDVTTAVAMERMGRLFLTVGDTTLNQCDTQTNDGGMTTCYLETGTYRKSFYSVVACPSAVKIGVISDGHARIHHNVSWSKVHPYILSEKWKKEKSYGRH